METKVSEVKKIIYTSKFVYSIIFLLYILESFVFLIIGRNNPNTYNKIITSDTINIDLTAFSFIKLFFFQSRK